MKKQKKMPKTLLLNKYFDDNFSFSKEQLIAIKKTSLSTGISEEIIKELLFHLFKKSFRELCIDSFERVEIDFKYFKLINH